MSYHKKTINKKVKLPVPRLELTEGQLVLVHSKIDGATNIYIGEYNPEIESELRIARTYAKAFRMPLFVELVILVLDKE